LTYRPDTLIDRSFREKIVLVGVLFPGVTSDELDYQLDELALLVDTAGADVVARIIQRRDSPDPATFLGSGKVQELREICLAVDSDTVVFEHNLSPAQQRNLEKILGRTAIDRTAVILDIFAQNARTPEGKAQVELALLQYRLPRLRRADGSLSRGDRAKPNSKPTVVAWSIGSTRFVANSKRSTAPATSSARAVRVVATVR
jgi:GTP-binding protein HflX